MVRFIHIGWERVSSISKVCVRARQCVHIGPYSQTTLMSLGAAHPLPNWRKNISYWKYDSVWKGKKVYEKQEAENITCEKEENGEWWRGQDKGVSTRLLLIQVPSNSNDQHCDMQATTGGKKLLKLKEEVTFSLPLAWLKWSAVLKDQNYWGGGGVPSTSKAAAFSCCKRTLTRANYTKQYPHVKSQKIGKYF